MVSIEESHEDVEEMQLGFWSVCKLLLIQHLPCKNQYLSKKEKAYFNAIEKLEKETDIVRVVRTLRLTQASLKALLTPRKLD